MRIRDKLRIGKLEAGGFAYRLLDQVFSPRMFSHRISRRVAAASLDRWHPKFPMRENIEGTAANERASLQRDAGDEAINN